MKTLTATSPVPLDPFTLALSKSLGSMLLVSGMLAMVVWLVSDLPFPIKSFQAEALPLPAQNMHLPILSQRVFSAPKQTARAIHHATRNPAKAPVTEVELKSAPLHSNVKRYTYVFAGKVWCGTSPCAAGHVTVRVTSQHDDEITQQAAIERDGTYQIRIGLDETPKHMVDWVISANNGHGESIEQGGRQILTNDTEVTVQTQMHLES